MRMGRYTRRDNSLRPAKSMPTYFPRCPQPAQFLYTTAPHHTRMARSVAEALAEKQREISVAEFFQKNRQILGFDSLTKSMVVAVKEGVDNALDACEDAGILPEVSVEIRQEGKDEYLVVIEDNGPGIVRRNIPRVFGKLLYGSRFHAVRQSRGQQGIGISAVVLYGQLTTGRPARVISKVAEEEVAYELDLTVDTKTNEPHVLKEKPVIWEKPHGTRVEVCIRARYQRGRQSVYEYLQNTAIVNPHARISLIEPDGRRVVFERATEKMPPPPVEIKPHPHGIELGELMSLARDTKAYRLTSFLSGEFSRVSPSLASRICDVASLDPYLRPADMTVMQAKRLIDAFGRVKIMAPPTDCLSPIGAQLIKKGLKNVLGGLRPGFYAQPVTREPSVYRGNPFVVEVGMVYGGDLPKDQPVRILRFANRVPLLYQQGACAITKAVANIDWRRYGLEQRGGSGIPIGPAIILVHVASTRIPFTSEAKEAIADVPEIRREIELALKDVARQIRMYVAKKKRKSKVSEKFFIVQKVIPEIARKAAEIVGKPVPPLEPVLSKVMNVVWVEEKVERGKGDFSVNVRVANLTTAPRSFRLYADVPAGRVMRESVSPPGEVSEDEVIKWDLPEIPPAGELTLAFRVEDVKGGYGETTFYVEGINPAMVIGAEPLPGDWGIKDLEVLESEEEVEE